MGFPHTLNLSSCQVVEEYVLGAGSHSVAEAAEATYDVVGYFGYLSFGSSQPVPAAAPGPAEHHTDAEAAAALKAMRTAPQGTQHALGANVPPWLKTFLVQLFLKLLAGG